MNSKVLQFNLESPSNLNIWYPVAYNVALLFLVTAIWLVTAHAIPLTQWVQFDSDGNLELLLYNSNIECDWMLFTTKW